MERVHNEIVDALNQVDSPGSALSFHADTSACFHSLVGVAHVDMTHCYELRDVTALACAVHVSFM